MLVASLGPGGSLFPGSLWSSPSLASSPLSVRGLFGPFFFPLRGGAVCLTLPLFLVFLVFLGFLVAVGDGPVAVVRPIASSAAALAASWRSDGCFRGTPTIDGHRGNLIPAEYK